MRKLSIPILIFVSSLFLNLQIPSLVLAQTCNLNPPLNVTAAPGPGNNQISLHWTPVLNSDHYSLVYGTKTGKYIFGVANLGKSPTNNFTVDNLKPGVRYFFKVGAVKDCSSLSPEVSATSKSSQGSTLGISKKVMRRYVVQNGDTLANIA